MTILCSGKQDKGQILTAAPGGGWCWFSDPRAVYYNGQTYFGYMLDGVDGRPYVRSYNHATKVLGAAFDLYGGIAFESDDHDNPAFIIRESDKRLIAFFSTHGTDPGDHYVRISTNPEDASAWDAVVNIRATTGGVHPTYMNPVQLTGEANDPIYCFFREYFDVGLTYQGWSYTKSVNEGATWSAKTKVVRITYTKCACNGTDRIDFCGSEHPADAGDHGIYHFYYQGGNYYKTDGTQIVSALPLAISDLTQVYDGSSVKGWIWDIAIEPATGYPVIVYATFPTEYTDHRYNYARWTGAAWDAHEICAGGGGILGGSAVVYSGGVVLDHNDPNIVYASREVSGQWEIYRYVTADGGAMFTEQAITVSSASKQLRPVAVRDHSDLLALWLTGTYTTYLNYSQGINGLFQQRKLLWSGSKVLKS